MKSFANNLKPYLAAASINPVVGLAGDKNCRDMAISMTKLNEQCDRGVLAIGKPHSREHESDKGSENVNKELNKQEINKKIKNLQIFYIK